LQVIQVGGAKLLPSLAEQIIDKLQGKLQQVYGMAEGLVNFTHLDDPDQIIIQTQGKKLSHLDEIRIADQDGNALPVNAIGNIQTRGPYTING
ncbi:AMP-binding protein, partial [Escherichia coli]|uniref:AMP-binding protein n=1 Tax=Escherichia coli TaxID=562 RepID=UPI001EDA5B89